LKSGDRFQREPILRAADMMSLKSTEQNGVLEGLSDEDYENLIYDWSMWARPDQRAPESDWIYWLILAGRGAGKTRVGAEVVRAWAKDCTYVNMIGPTQDDVREVMVEGESGILNICPSAERPRFSAASQRLDWPNGSVSLLFSAEEPDRLRGKQHTKLWMDELAAWRRPETFDQAAFGLRLGPRPQAILTTTPRPSRLIKSLLADKDTIVTRATTFDNKLFLPRGFLDRIISRYEGRSIGRQELMAEIIEEAPGALWTRELLDRQRLSADGVYDYNLIVIGVDPPARSGSKADECGIVVVGKRSNGEIHVLADLTSQGETPGQWGARVGAAYRRYKANRIVAEINNGGDMVVEVLRQAEPNLPVRKVTATRGKFLRAEPVATAYERGLVSHLGLFQALEDQLCTLTPDFDSRSAGFSPDRADALVWAISNLIEPEDAQTLLEYYASYKKS
jgi:phage terminase large subunit-like protein